VISLSIGFGSCLSIDGIDDSISEIVQSFNNLSNDSLIREVLI